jgi:hypothetical protein
MSGGPFSNGPPGVGPLFIGNERDCLATGPAFG